MIDLHVGKIIEMPYDFAFLIKGYHYLIIESIIEDIFFCRNVEGFGGSEYRRSDIEKYNMPKYFPSGF